MGKSRFKILIIPGISPFPPTDGGRVCIYAFIESLRFRHDLHLFLPVYNEEMLSLVESYKKKLPEVVFHTPDFIAHIPKRSFIRKVLGKIMRLLLLIINFLKQLLVRNSSGPGNSPAASFQNVERALPFVPYPENYIHHLKQVLQQQSFDIVQMEYTPTLNLINVIPEGPKKVFVELESRHSIIRDLGNLSGIDKQYVDYISGNTKFIEYAFMKKYDAIFALNKSDYLEMGAGLQGVKVYNSPFPVLDSQLSDENPDEFKPEKLIFLGGEFHSPNVDAVFWFAKEVMPELKSLNIKLHVTGTWRDQTKKYLKQIQPDIEFTGMVRDLNPVMKNSVSIVPIRLGGGGLRAKIIHSMAAGIPLVTTSVACIGLDAKHEHEYLIADSPVEFAGAIGRLFRDHVFARKLIANSRVFIQNNFTQKILAEKRDACYQALMN